MSESLARAAVRSRAGGRCELCRRPATNWAHRVGRGQGGLWVASNGLLLCGSGTTGCHGWTHAERDLSRAGGWIVDSGEHPAGVPVWLRSPWQAGWHLLDDDACYTPLWSHDAPTPVLPPWTAAA